MIRSSRSGGRDVVEGSEAVFFLFWFGSDVKEERRPAGTFDCPRCRRRQPCEIVRTKRTVKLYSVLPVWTSTLGEVHVCQVCGAREGEAPPSVSPYRHLALPALRQRQSREHDSCLGCGRGYGASRQRRRGHEWEINPELPEYGPPDVLPTRGGRETHPKDDELLISVRRGVRSIALD